MAVYTVDDLLTMALRRTEQKPASISSPSDPSRFLHNRMQLAHSWINAQAPWEWLRTEGEVALIGYQNSGTVTVTAGSADYVLSGGAADALFVGGAMEVTSTGGVKDIMRVLTVGATGTFTTAWALVGTSGLSYTLGQDTYALPSNFDKPLATNGYISAAWNMTAYDPERFQKARSYSHSGTSTYMTTGQPTIYTIWGEGAGSQKLIVWPFPSVSSMLTIKYWRTPVSLAATGAIPDLPEKYQTILIDMALDHWYRDRELDMTKRGIHKALWQEKLMQMLGQVERSSDRMAMQPADNRSHYA